MNCNEALTLMDSVLDGEASPEQKQLLQFHINGCNSCRRAFQLNTSISNKMKTLEEPVPDSRLLEVVQQRLSSGNYDHSPLSKSTRSPVWRIAAVIPFAAALILFIHNFGGGNSSDYNNQSIKSAAIEQSNVHYTPAPVVAYSRSSSVTTF